MAASMRPLGRALHRRGGGRAGRGHRRCSATAPPATPPISRRSGAAMYEDVNARPPDRPPTDHAPDGIDEGKRLIRLGGDKGLSLADRLVRAASTGSHGGRPLHTIAAEGPLSAEADRGARRSRLSAFRRAWSGLAGRRADQLSRRDAGIIVETIDLGQAATVGKAVCRTFPRLRLAARPVDRGDAGRKGLTGRRISDGALARTRYADSRSGGWHGRADLWGRRILFWTSARPADPVVDRPRSTGRRC